MNDQLAAAQILAGRAARSAGAVLSACSCSSRRCMPRSACAASRWGRLERPRLRDRICLRGGIAAARRARRLCGGLHHERARRTHRRSTCWVAAMVHRVSGIELACFLPIHFLVLGLAIERGGARRDLPQDRTAGGQNCRGRIDLPARGSCPRRSAAADRKFHVAGQKFGSRSAPLRVGLRVVFLVG